MSSHGMKGGDAIWIVGVLVYPEPASEMVILTTTPLLTVALATAPIPPPPTIFTKGAFV
jgi:hypothetical protein